MSTSRYALDAERLDDLVDALLDEGYEVIGPTVEDEVFAVGALASAAGLPRGWIDEQGPGIYRARENGEAVFGYAALPDGFKRYRLPPQETLQRIERHEGRLRVLQDDPPAPPRALLGMRACDLAALGVHDRAMKGDTRYEARRAALFLIVAPCTRAGENCFCASMGTGPEPSAGFDLSLVELAWPPRFVIEVGSERGQEIVDGLELEAAPSTDVDASRAALQGAAKQMGRQLETRDLPGLLRDELDHHRWREVGERCLACGSCTMVCPTCFCSTIDDKLDVTGTQVERVRRWDSCFSADFTYLHGGRVRGSVRSRYRQWLTHKLDGWHDQFGGSGCVGCGRCITWCPVGIDLTQEVAAIRGAEVLEHDPAEAQGDT